MKSHYARTDGERLVALETRMCEIEETLNEVRGDVKEIRRAFSSFVDEADKRYANKIAERLIFGMAGATLLSVMYLVLRTSGL